MSDHRLEDEQIQADQVFIDSLKNSMSGWIAELDQVQEKVCDQALLDAKSGTRSDIYSRLEQRERELQEMITEAQRKLGQVGQRYSIGPLSGLLNKVLNQVKPSK